MLRRRTSLAWRCRPGSRCGAMSSGVCAADLTSPGKLLPSSSIPLTLASGFMARKNDAWTAFAARPCAFRVALGRPTFLREVASALASTEVVIVFAALKSNASRVAHIRNRWLIRPDFGVQALGLSTFDLLTFKCRLRRVATIHDHTESTMSTHGSHSSLLVACCVPFWTHAMQSVD